MSKDNSFEDIYSEAIENAIKIMGDTVSKIIVDYLNDKYSIDIMKTSDNPDLLDEALNNSIDGGKLIIERRMLNYIYNKIGLIENKGSATVSFEKRIKHIRDKYNELSKRHQ